MAAYKVVSRLYGEHKFVRFTARWDAKRWPLVTPYGYRGPMVEYEAQKIGDDVWVWVKHSTMSSNRQLLKRIPFSGREDDFDGIYNVAREFLRA